MKSSETRTFEPFVQAQIEQTIPSCFERQAGLHAQRLAIKTATHQWTYDQLNREANRIAHAILARDQAGRTPVMVLLEQGALPVAALLGVWKAGKIAVPLDPSTPLNRLSQLAGEASPTSVVTSGRHRDAADRLIADGGVVVGLDALDPGLPEHNPSMPGSPDDPAMILYTSGSTGRPKGTVCDHRIWIHNAGNYINAFQVGPEDRLTLFALATSQAIKNIFLALVSGASLFPHDARQHGTDAVVSLLSRERITITVMGASLFRALSDALEGAGAEFPMLRMIRLGSETVQASDLELYRRHFPPHCRLVNGLASGEMGTIRFFSIDHNTRVSGNLVPVGYPVEDKTVLLLDDAGHDVAPGEVGEIVVESRFLGLEYWRRPDLTAAAFQPAATPGGARRYRSGDLGRLEPDGALVCLGRKNARVKIRGHGVDLIEIEAVLRGLPPVKEAVVVAREGRMGYAQLVAYVVPIALPGPTNGALRQALRESLPDYMIPSTFVVLASLPRTTSGKTDRQALPEPGRPYRDPHRPPTPPSTPVEAAIAKIWSSVMKLDAIDVHDHFYDLGGESLQAMRIMAGVRKAFSVDIDLQSLLEAPTIAEMAAVVDRRRAARANPDERPVSPDDATRDSSHLVEVQPGQGRRPVFFIPGGVGGEGEFFLHARLARRVGPEFPFYWLKARSAVGGRASAETVEEMAADYVREIRTRQGHGPYIVVGDCGGGVIAYEVAQQLHAAGQQLALLLFMDTIRPDHASALRGILAGFPRWTYHREALRPLRRSEQLSYLWGVASRALRASAGALWHGGIRATYARARYRYQPSHYPGTLTLLLSEDLARLGQSLGWEEVVGGGIEVHRLRGNHVTYMRRYVDSTAETLRACLERATQASSESHGTREPSVANIRASG
jgi:amino acid adenylation domain-containing protein